MPLRLHGITLAEAPPDESSGGSGAGDKAASGVTAPRLSRAIDLNRVGFRDLSAVVSDQPSFALIPPTPEAVDKHRAIVDASFKRGSVLPAPLGVVFRSADVLTRWMEFHYVSLTSALEYVDGRCAARVHVVRADGKPDELEPDTDLASQAVEAARAIRRRAVAGVPLRSEQQTRAGIELGSAFLVESSAWTDFLEAVEEQKDAHHLLRFEVTGPWAPYDFVRMQFGG